jgi:hypothetical protein
MQHPGPFKLDLPGMAKESENHSDKEAKARFEAALKGAMNAPHKLAKGKAQSKESQTEEEARQMSRDSNYWRRP